MGANCCKDRHQRPAIEQREPVQSQSRRVLHFDAPSASDLHRFSVGSIASVRPSDADDVDEESTDTDDDEPQVESMAGRRLSAPRIRYNQRYSERKRSQSMDDVGGASISEESTADGDVPSAARRRFSLRQRRLSIRRQSDATDDGSTSLPVCDEDVATIALGSSDVVVVINVDRSSGQKLGMALDKATLVVENVSIEGMIAQWNQDNPSDAVGVGDKVTDVNGKNNPCEVLEECKTAKQLSITISRGESAAVDSLEGVSSGDSGIAVDSAAATRPP